MEKFVSHHDKHHEDFDILYVSDVLVLKHEISTEFEKHCSFDGSGASSDKKRKDSDSIKKHIAGISSKLAKCPPQKKLSQ
jgi:hypothetical protein